MHKCNINCLKIVSFSYMPQSYPFRFWIHNTQQISRRKTSFIFHKKKFYFAYPTGCTNWNRLKQFPFIDIFCQMKFRCYYQCRAFLRNSYNVVENVCTPTTFWESTESVERAFHTPNIKRKKKVSQTLNFLFCFRLRGKH